MSAPADYRCDPRWLAAREQYTSDTGPQESATGAMLRRLDAARAMYRVERESELTPAGGGARGEVA